MDRFLEMQQLIKSRVAPSGDLSQREVRFRMFPDTPEGQEARKLTLLKAEEEKKRAEQARKAEQAASLYGNQN